MKPGNHSDPRAHHRHNRRRNTHSDALMAEFGLEGGFVFDSA